MELTQELKHLKRGWEYYGASSQLTGCSVYGCGSKKPGES